MIVSLIGLLLLLASLCYEFFFSKKPLITFDYLSNQCYRENEKELQEITQDYSFLMFICLAFVIFFGSFGLMTSQVKQSSMNPTLQNDDYVLVNIFPFLDYQHGDIVAIYIPVGPTPGHHMEVITSPDYWVKRIFALPGDNLEYLPADGNVQVGSIVNHTTGVTKPNSDTDEHYIQIGDWLGFINDGLSSNLHDEYNRPFTFIVPPQKYICFGDNWNVSSDSRKYGMFDRYNFKGRVMNKIKPWVNLYD
jgi:signal peptidase I